MENIIFYGIICASFLIILVLCIIGGIILNYITRVGNVLADNQQKLSRQINSVKTNNIQLSTYDCIAINNIIATLTRIEEEKCMSYKQEISLLNKILYNGQK